MNDIQKYLERFKNLIQNKEFVESCCKSVFDEMGLPILKKDFEVVGGVVRLKIKNPLIRSELKLKKDKILDKVNLQIGQNKIFDIY